MNEAATIAALRYRVPLTISASLGLPGPPRALPHVYGKNVPCWGAGIPTNDKFTWVVAGHHIDELVGVSGMDASGSPLAEGTLVNTFDPDGRAIAVVRLARIADGTPLFLMKGKSGDPAAILYDLMVNICGLSLFRSQILEADSAGIFVGELCGRVDDPTKTLRATVDEICMNAGADWSLGRPTGIMQMLPIASSSVRSFRKRDLRDVTCETTLDSLRNQIRMLYSTGRAGQVMQRIPALAGALFGGVHSPSTGAIASPAFGGRLPVIEAPSGELEAVLGGRVPGSIRRYGVRDATIELRWVRTLQQAARVLGLALADGQRPAISVSADIDLDLDLQPGDRVDVDDPHVPDIGQWLVVGADPDQERHTTHLTLRAFAGGPAMASVIDYPDPQRPASIFAGLASADDNERTIDESVTEPPVDEKTSTNAAQQSRPESFIVAVSDETTPIAVGDALRSIHVPYDFMLQEIQATTTSNATSSSAMRVRVRGEGADVIADFDLNTGALGLFTPRPVSDWKLTKSRRLAFDVLSLGDGDVTGLKFNLVGHQA